MTISATPPLDARLWALAERDNTHPSPVAYIAEAMAGRERQQLTFTTIIADQVSPAVLLAQLAGAGAKVLDRGTVSLVLVPDQRGPFVLSVWTTAYEGVFHVASSVPVTQSRWKRVERWIDDAAPYMMKCLLDHDDFADVATSLFEYGQVEVRQFTARSRVDGHSIDEAWPSRPGMLRPTPADVLQANEDRQADVRTMTLVVDGAVELHLRRVAGATYYAGDLNLFHDAVLNRLARAAAARRELLSNRERHVGTASPRPIVVQLPGDIFCTSEDTGRLIADVASQPETAVAILHRNPYLHVVVTDYRDGSNFDVFVTRGDRIEIHPGYRASLGALTRLAQRLGERFHALAISEAPVQRRVSLHDLVTTV